LRKSCVYVLILDILLFLLINIEDVLEIFLQEIVLNNITYLCIVLNDIKKSIDLVIKILRLKF